MGLHQWTQDGTCGSANVLHQTTLAHFQNIVPQALFLFPIFLHFFLLCVFEREREKAWIQDYIVLKYTHLLCITFGVQRSLINMNKYSLRCIPKLKRIA